MAGKPVGTIFVELDLDASRYTKGQQKLLKDATSTSTIIEQNFQNLGIKSAAHFDLLRAKIKNSYEAIANSSRLSAAEIIRAEEAKNAKLKALNAQQFGAQVGAIDKMRANWIAGSAAIAAAMVTIHKALTYMEEGSKALQVESSFKIMADSAGVNSERMIASMKEATKETIDDSAMMQKAIKLMLLGYNPEQVERFSRVVITASQIAGTSAAEAYDSLADAIANRMPKSLIKMGAVTKEQMKIVNAAIEAGADSIALYELAMANLELKQKMLQGTMDQASLMMQRLKARTDEATESIGKGLIAALDLAFRGCEYLAAGVMGLAAAYASYRALIYKVMGDEKQEAKNREYANWALAQKTEHLKNATYGIAGEAAAQKVATKEEIAGAKAKVDSQMSAMKAIVDAEKGKKDMLSNLSKEYKNLYDQQIEGAEHAAKVSQDAGQNELITIKNLYDAKADALIKWYDDQAEAIRKYSKTPAVAVSGKAALDSEYTKKVLENENAKQEAVMAYGKKRIEVESSMYKEINQYSTESMRSQIADIELKARENGRWTEDEIAKAGALAEAIMKLEDAKTAKALSGFAVINEYSDQSYALRESQYKREARLVEAATNGEVSASAYVAKKVQEDRNKMFSAAAQYYDSVIGFSREWLALVIANLEAEREKVAEVTRDEAFSYAWLADQKRRAQNAAAIKGDDFMAGFGAQMDEYKRLAVTAGEQGAAVAEAITSSMEDNMTAFFDSTSEKFLNFKDLALSILRDISNALIKELITKPLVAGMVGGGGGWGSLIGGLFGSMFGSGGGGFTAGQGYTATPRHSGGIMDEGGPTRRVPALSFANAPRYHDGFAPNEIPAILNRDEGVFTPGQMKALGNRSVSINVPVSITAGGGIDERRLSYRMREEMETTAKRVLAEEMR